MRQSRIAESYHSQTKDPIRTDTSTRFRISAAP